MFTYIYTCKMYDTKNILSNIFTVISNLYLLFKNELKVYKKIRNIWHLFFPDLPEATISTELQVYLGSAAEIRSKVSSTPPLNEFKWQKSVDGNKFQCIDINKREYHGTDGLKNPFLVIPITTFDDILHYRLLVRNIFGGCVSNTVYINVTGSMFSRVM